MKKGVIYILTNPSFPDFIKIGYTQDIKERLKQLNRSESIPFAFRAYASYEVDKEMTDKELHKIIDLLNPNLRAIDKFGGKNRKKEFFAMSKENAYSLLKSIARFQGKEDGLKLISPEGYELQDEQIAEEIRKKAKKKDRFTFSECGIPIGAKISFLHDSSVVATVVDNKNVKYMGRTRTLTGLAKELLGVKYSVQGPAYFAYKGKKLTDIREELATPEN